MFPNNPSTCARVCEECYYCDTSLSLVERSARPPGRLLRSDMSTISTTISTSSLAAGRSSKKYVPCVHPSESFGKKVHSTAFSSSSTLLFLACSPPARAHAVCARAARVHTGAYAMGRSSRVAIAAASDSTSDSRGTPALVACASAGAASPLSELVDTAVASAASDTHGVSNTPSSVGAAAAAVESAALAVQVYVLSATLFLLSFSPIFLLFSPSLPKAFAYAAHATWNRALSLAATLVAIVANAATQVSTKCFSSPAAGFGVLFVGYIIFRMFLSLETFLSTLDALQPSPVATVDAAQASPECPTSITASADIARRGDVVNSCGHDGGTVELNPHAPSFSAEPPRVAVYDMDEDKHTHIIHDRRERLGFDIPEWKTGSYPFWNVERSSKMRSIVVETASGRHLPLDVKLSDTIGTVKTKICDNHMVRALCMCPILTSVSTVRKALFYSVHMCFNQRICQDDKQSCTIPPR